MGIIVRMWNNFENNRLISKEFPERIIAEFKSIIDLSLHASSNAYDDLHALSGHNQLLVHSVVV